MRVSILITAVILAVSAGTIRPAFSQQFRVYTEVTVPDRDITPGKAQGEVVARSLTVFHAGRVFDWLQTAGEVTIFEPAHERFVIFNGRKMIATTVAFKEIERMLASAHDETSNHAERLSTRPDREARTIASSLQFQLDPKFDQRFQRQSLKLDLESPMLTYRVDCGAAEIPESVEAYLNYADWTARLNHVMHPRSLYPAARLMLNDSLREHKVLPVTVQLRVDMDQPIVLQAEHKFAWQLEKVDRQHIRYWDDKLEDRSLEWLSFRDYQRAILQTSAQARR